MPSQNQERLPQGHQWKSSLSPRVNVFGCFVWSKHLRSEAFLQMSHVLSHVKEIFAVLHSWDWCWTLATVLISESHEFAFHVQMQNPPLHAGVGLTCFTLPPEVSCFTLAVPKFLQCLCQACNTRADKDTSVFVRHVTARRACSGVLHQQFILEGFFLFFYGWFE